MNANNGSIKQVNVFLMGAIAAISGLLFGFDTGVISGAQEFLFSHFQLKDGNLQDDALRGLVVASVPIGALLGAMLSGFFAQNLGRRRSLKITAIMFLIGTLSAALAPHLYSVAVGRFIMGLAIGISAMVAPMYLAEVSPPNVRGSIIFLFQLAITIGLFLSFAIDLWFAQIFEPDVCWRYMFGAGIIPAVALFIGMLQLPQSPRWLMLKNRIEEAKMVMQQLLGRHNVQAEMDEMQESCHREQGKNWTALFRKPLLPLLGIAFGLFVFQQLSGINAVMYYGPSIFSKAGFNAGGEFWAQLCIGLVNVLATVFGVWVVDKLGRRPLLFVGFFGLIICLGGLSYCLKTNGLHPYVCLTLTLLYVVFFAISLGGVPYILMSELFPLKVRSAGMAIASCANWGFNMLVAFSFKLLVNFLGNVGNVFALYMTCTVIGFLFAYRFIPETKGRNLEEIEDNLYEGKELIQLGEATSVEEQPAEKYQY